LDRSIGLDAHGGDLQARGLDGLDGPLNVALGEENGATTDAGRRRFRLGRFRGDGLGLGRLTTVCRHENTATAAEGTSPSRRFCANDKRPL
jgi:hypothetical protein